MKLPTPSAPFSPVYVHGESITIETEGKVLVLPSGNPDILTSHNEYTLNSNRLSIAESPFGGLKGSGSPDYAPGTVNIIEGDGVYLQDVNGQNSSKTLSAGKLKELNLMSVDTVNHSITEEFIVANTSESNNPVVIDACDSVSGWNVFSGSLSITSTDGKLSITGTADEIGEARITKTIGTVLASSQIIAYDLTVNINCRLIFTLFRRGSTSTFLTWKNRNIALSANVPTRFVLPLLTPTGSISVYPDGRSSGFSLADSLDFNIGVQTTAGNSVTFTIDNITADTAKSATIEAQVPDNLSATSLSLYTHDGTTYQLCSTHSLDGAYSQIAQTSANCTFLDGTKLDDVYGAGLGRAVFPKGSAGDTKAGSSGNITYSENRGTDKRIGLKVDLPPSDNGRTNFNKVRAKLVINYAPDAENVYSATHIFADSTNTSYGLQNLSKPWIALYDPAKTEIDFYLFTYRPKNLEFKRDESGTIHELKLFPGNGQLYHGRITHCNPVLDSDSDLVPNCLKQNLHFSTQDGQTFTTADGAYFDVNMDSQNGSLFKFLEAYGMVI